VQERGKRRGNRKDLAEKAEDGACELLVEMGGEGAGKGRV